MKALPFDQQPRWIIAAVSNGCGGKGSIVDPPDGKYAPCCDQHDLGYTVGGSEEDKNRVDGEFLVSMIRVVVAHRKGIARLFYLLTAILYFYGVAYAGRKFFRYGEPLTQEELESYAKDILASEALVTNTNTVLAENNPPICDPSLKDISPKDLRKPLPKNNDLDELRRRLENN